MDGSANGGDEEAQPRKSSRPPKPKRADDMLRTEDLDEEHRSAFQSKFVVGRSKRAADGEAPRRKKRPVGSRAPKSERYEGEAEEEELAQLGGDGEWSHEQPGGTGSYGDATKFKDRPGAWDARMQSALSALLSRLLRSRRALEAAWTYAPGATPELTSRAMRVVPQLQPDVRAVCAALDHCQVPSMATLLSDVKAACDTACAKALAGSRAPSCVAEPRATEPWRPAGACSPPPSCDPPPSAAAQEESSEPLCSSEQLEQSAAWLAEALRMVLRTCEAAISLGMAPLPHFIAHNHEPYVQSEWRTVPFQRRPYVRLGDYQIMTDGLEGEVADLAAKLTAGPAPAGGCTGDCCGSRAQLGTFSLLSGCFVGACACLNSSRECGPACGCAQRGGACANTAVTQRRTLQLGVHVVESDVWGLDCYSRRNVHEAAREAHLLDDAPEGVITTWTERALLPAINRQGPRGWDIKAALRDVHSRAKAAGDRWSASVAAAVASRVSRVGRAFFRTHPKGCGILCVAPGGLPAQTFVEEYFGEVHPPWRWFEKQDALKRRRRAGDLPDFYNICLDRPKDDAGGFDVVFVDAAPAGSFASRLSHSCQPNCQAVVMSAGGRLTIAVYTLRWIAQGEELTFDYSSVTESDAEYRAAICLCGTSRCRGSFLYWAGSSSFQQVMSMRHTFLDRNALLARAGAESVTEGDRARLEAWGVRGCALGGGCWGTYEVPQWLVKWTALTLEYVEAERRDLPAALCALRSPHAYTPDSAAEQARGVAENRLQNLVITLDKVKHVLRQPGQPQGAPLRALSDSEAAEMLWTGVDSVARRLVDTASSHLCYACKMAGLPGGAHETLGCAALGRLRKLLDVREGEATDAAAAAARLLAMEAILRSVDSSKPGGGRHAAAADLARLYARTRQFFTMERYLGVTSPPVTLRIEELGWQDGAPDNEWHLTPASLAEGDVPLGAGARTANAAAAAARSAAAAAVAAAPAASVDEAEGEEEEAAASFEEDWWTTEARTAVPWDVAGSGSMLPQEDPSLAEALFSPAVAQGQSEGGDTPQLHAQTHAPLPQATLSPLAGVPSRRLMDALRASAVAAQAQAGDGPEDAVAATAPDEVFAAAARPPPLSALQEAKKYRSAFVWGQLIGWFKQTVLDPTASLSVDRRGTVSLPDVESCYGKYGLRDRNAALQLLHDSPASLWPPGTSWSFKNAAMLYGSPMLDAAVARSRGEEPQLLRLVDELRNAK